MASSLEYVQYAADQLRGAGTITYRKMFGEYGLYCDGKFFGCICDNQVFVKITEAGGRVIPDLAQSPPYEGAGPSFLVETLDDRALMAEFISETCRELPFPTPRKRKKPGGTNERGGRAT